jgi:signal peptidase I
MSEPGGNNPNDPHIVPAQPGREPLPGPNGPFRAASERIAPQPGARAPAQAHATPEKETGKKQPEHKDAFREIVETIVFVVVLVLLLKGFLAEAFVIPTGSMATTLLGYHKVITCPQCKTRFPLNMSKYYDPAEPANEPITGCTCPNCFLHIDASNSEEFKGR